VRDDGEQSLTFTRRALSVGKQPRMLGRHSQPRRKLVYECLIRRERALPFERDGSDDAVTGADLCCQTGLRHRHLTVKNNIT